MSFALAGCAHLSLPGPALSGPQPTRDRNVARVLEKAGIGKLRAGRYKEASRIFNAGLKFDPTSADLNFLNGLAYQLRYLRGNQAMLGLAGVGYGLALRYNPAHYYAALQLGRLHFEARNYGKAAGAFQRAIDIRPDSGAAYLGLASADYYLRKLSRARAAAAKAASLMPRSAESARAQAMIYAALGDATKARAASVRYATLEENPVARTSLDRRLHEWRLWHVSYPEQSVVGAVAKKPLLLAQAGGAPKVFSPKPGSGAHAAKQRVPRLAWYDCSASGNNQGSGDQSSGGSSGYGGSSNHELPALPSPCVGAPPPRMVILDVVFVETDNLASTSYGINLLQGLNFVFGLERVGTYNRTIPNFGTPSTHTIQLTQSASLGAAQFGSEIAYSLNIMNSTNDRTEVLSRPSLIALDRMPSTFFSGANLTVGLVGGAGSYGSIDNQPVGTRLSVTPTFIGKDELLLSVRAERSYLSSIDINVNFQQAYQTTSNVISADVALKMGQTLILSGLTEQEKNRIANGVPVLKDIPGLQYLFNNTATQTYQKSVLVLITPRPATTAADQALMRKSLRRMAISRSATERHYAPLIAKRLRGSHGSMPANLPSAYAYAASNTLFLQYRTGDLSLQRWVNPSRLSRFFDQLGDALYYSNE